MVDVAALPGKHAVRSADAIDKMAATFEEVMNFRKARTGGFARDTQWNTDSRNVLLSVKTAETLSDKTRELQEEQTKVVEASVSRYKVVLEREGWDQVSTKLWLQAGVMPRMVQASLTAYLSLLLEAQGQFQTFGWPHAQDFVHHHGTELSRIRTYAPSRFRMVIQTYVYLRDAQKSRFNSLKLLWRRQEVLTQATQHTSGSG